MNCPVDGTQLQMTERQGVEIDYCPTCRGVWLDRGELDKIIERAASVPDAADGDAFTEGRSRGGHHGEGHDRGGAKRRRRSMLGDLFDFG